MLRKIISSDTYSQRWDKVNDLIEELKRMTPLKGQGLHIQRTCVGAILETDPIDGKAEFDTYEGPFCVKLSPDMTEVTILDPADYSESAAGYAYINGFFREIESETLTVAQGNFRSCTIEGPDGTTVAAQEGFICLYLNSSGEVGFTIKDYPDNDLYDGEFAVNFSASTGKLNVFDGSFKSGSGTAGHAFLNGTWTSIPSGSLTLKNGYLCLKYSAAGVSYEIVNNPKRITYGV